MYFLFEGSRFLAPFFLFSNLFLCNFFRVLTSQLLLDDLGVKRNFHLIKSGDKIKREKYKKVIEKNPICQLKCNFSSC